MIIECEDLKDYFLLAMLVDNVKFLEFVENIRKKYKIKILPRNQIDKYFELPIIDDHYVPDPDEVPSPSNVKIHKHPEYLKIEINEIITKLKIPHKLTKVIFYAILSNHVRGEDITLDGYDGMSISTDNSRIFALLPGTQYHIEENEIALIVNPETSQADLITAFNQIKKKSPYINNRWKLKSDIITNIKRDRNWYLLKKQGLSYLEIMKQANKSNIKISRDGIIKAIKQYSRALSMYF